MGWKLLLLAMLALAGARGHAEEITLSNGEWKPYLSEELPHYGVLSRIVSEAFALEGVTVRYVFRPWARAYAEALSGTVQGSLVWSVGMPGSTRARNFQFSDLVFQDASVFFYRKDTNFRWTELSDLSKYRIGGVAGYEYGFEKMPSIHIDRGASSDELSLRKLLAGRFDVLPSSLGVGRYLLHTRFSAADATRITWDPRPYNSSRYYLILPRTLPRSAHYLALFNKGLRRLKDSGRYAAYLADLDAGKY